MAKNRIPRPTRQAISCYVVRGSALSISERIPCLETPRSSNSISCECDLAKVVHSRARPPCFSSVFVRLFTAYCPASFSWAGIAILARKVTLEFCAILEMTQTARDLLLARPAGRVLGDRRRFSCPHGFFCHTKTRLVRVQRVDRGRTHSNAPSFRAQWRRHPACLVERCTGLAPQIPPGPCPTSIELTGLGAVEGFGSWRRRMTTRTL